MPIVWDLQQLRREHRERDDGPRATPAALDGFLQTMHDDGMCSGIMYSMAVPGTRLHVHELHRAAPHARMDHAGDDRAGAVDRAVGAQVRVAAADLDVARTRGEQLTPFEQELLLGIAEGASDKEIGRRLDTSAHNVDYHLRKLRKRFGVANRIQLTYLTSKLELI